MIQNIHPHIFENKYIATCDIKESDYIFCFKENQLLLKINGTNLSFLQKKDITGLASITEGTFLFLLNNINCFLVWDCPDVNDEHFDYHEISFFRTFQQNEIAWAGIIAFQLKNWYTQNRFCGVCGTATTIKTDERAITCNACGTMVYPKVSPAIIVAIICNNKLLLAHNSNFKANWYSLIAGYADIGETLEQCVIREVKEEVGLDVRNIRYYKSQPWPYSGSMMIGFVAEADENQPIKVDNKEITEAAWFSRGNLPPHPTTYSISGEMIELFEKGEW
jgi:NAD+ diphosphatase